MQRVSAKAGTRHAVSVPKKFDKIDTMFGVVTVLERKDGKITVLIEDNITATFNEIGFFADFVLCKEKDEKSL